MAQKVNRRWISDGQMVGGDGEEVDRRQAGGGQEMDKNEQELESMWRKKQEMDSRSTGDGQAVDRTWI